MSASVFSTRCWALQRSHLPVLLLVLFLGSICPSASGQVGLNWKKVDDGLHLAEYASPQKSAIGDNLITVLKIDPAHWEFDLLSAKESGESLRTAKAWGDEKGLTAVINAGMYQGDFATNVGYMKDGGFTNNARLNADNTILAFNPVTDDLPPVKIIDRTCENWETLKTQYQTFTQSIRMMDCNQKNRWSQQPKKWSMVVIGMDKAGNGLFIFARSPYSVHDFINILRGAGLDLYNLMYLEGGPEASFYLNHNGTTMAKMGSYETGFNENDDNHHFWPIPNVIGIRAKVE